MGLLKIQQNIKIKIQTLFMGCFWCRRERTRKVKSIFTRQRRELKWQGLLYPKSNGRHLQLVVSALLLLWRAFKGTVYSYFIGRIHGAESFVLWKNGVSEWISLLQIALFSKSGEQKDINSGEVDEKISTSKASFHEATYTKRIFSWREKVELVFKLHRSIKYFHR